MAILVTAFVGVGIFPARSVSAQSFSARPSPPSYLISRALASSLELYPSSGPVDAYIVITGSGFIPSHSLTVTWDGSTTGMPYYCSTNSSGEINAISSCSFAVPSSASGPHEVVVSDGTNSPAATFTVLTNETIYKVSITESGLPALTVWKTTFDEFSSQGSYNTVSFLNIADGHYPFTAGGVPGYTAIPTSGTITVNGSNVSLVIVFMASTWSGGGRTGLQNLPC